MSLELTELVERPDTGKVGKSVRVHANFFEVGAFPSNNVYRYDTEIRPLGKPIILYRKVWNSFEDTNGRGIFACVKAIYEGRKNVFSPKPLKLGEEGYNYFEVTIIFPFSLFVKKRFTSFVHTSCCIIPQLIMSMENTQNPYQFDNHNISNFLLYQRFHWQMQVDLVLLSVLMIFSRFVFKKLVRSIWKSFAFFDWSICLYIQLFNW